MKIIGVLKNTKYFILAVFSSTIMAAIYIYTQVLGIIQNIDLWFQIIPWYNAVLFTAFAVLFGITFSFQVYLWTQPKTCSITQKAAGAGSSGIGAFGLSFVSQCPACASLGALFLPITVISFLAQYSWVINLAAILLLIFTLNYLGAFKK